MDLNALTNPDTWLGWLQTAIAWLQAHLFVASNVVQLGAVLATFALALLVTPALDRLLARVPETDGLRRFGTPVVAAISPITRPFSWLVLLWFAVFAAQGAAWPHQLMEGVVSLLTAWVVIRLASGVIRNAAWSRSVAVLAWSVAALNLLGLLDPILTTLDQMALNLGEFRISALGVIKAGLLLTLFLYLAGLASKLAEKRIEGTTSLTPSMRVLFSKFARVLLYALAVVFALESVGIDLTVFAVFGGAIGLGIGFGLQKVVSNLMSGVILLVDRSVKPGDVIAIGDTFGWINTLGARYVSVITRDGTEHLIPNEELISQRVENWSFSDQLVRQKVPIGVDYNTDIHKARALAVEGASRVERALKEPKPVCHLIEFGDNAVVLELRFWINDPQNGVANVRSQVQLEIWDLYRDNGVVFPYPQRDLHLRSSVPIKVNLGNESENTRGSGGA